MQEPKRNSVLNSLSKSLNITNQKTFLHRLMYIIKYNDDACIKFGEWKTSMESVCKSANDEGMENPLFGMIIYSLEYVTCVLEGPEDGLSKHITYLMNKNLISQHKNKIFLLTHVAKRYFVDWQVINARPPVLLDTMLISSPHAEHAKMLKECITKLLKLSEYMSNRFEVPLYEPSDLVLPLVMDQRALFAASMCGIRFCDAIALDFWSEELDHNNNKRENNEVVENFSLTCKRILPEVAVLEFLLNSPILLSIEEYYQNKLSPLEYQLYHDTVWPSPPAFIPALLKKDMNT